MFLTQDLKQRTRNRGDSTEFMAMERYTLIKLPATRDALLIKMMLFQTDQLDVLEQPTFRIV